MIKKTSLLSMTICLCMIAMVSTSGALSPDLQQVRADIFEDRLGDTGRSFWDPRDASRYYFSPRNRLTVQYFGAAHMPIGTIVTGIWGVRDNMICIKYNQDDAKTHNISHDVLCHNLYIPRTTDPQALFKNDTETVILAREDRAGRLLNVISFSQNQQGNYIYKPEYVGAFTNAMNTMRGYLRNHGGKIPQADTSRAALPPTMQNYYNMVIDKVFTIDGSFYSYFHPSGRYGWVTAADIAAAQGDLQKLKSTVTIGSWTIKDRIHCWESGQKGASCEFIPDRDWFVDDNMPQGIVGLHSSGRIGVHTEGSGSIRHIPISATPVPELFEYIKEKLGG